MFIITSRIIIEQTKSPKLDCIVGSVTSPVNSASEDEITRVKNKLKFSIYQCMSLSGLKSKKTI